MDEINKATVQFFDLDTAKKEIQEEFLEDLGEVLMDAILQKAWSELDSNKKEELNALLEESKNDSKNVEKREEVLAFLDEHVINLQGYIEKELEKLQTTYRQTRDELRDASV